MIYCGRETRLTLILIVLGEAAEGEGIGDIESVPFVALVAIPEGLQSWMLCQRTCRSTHDFKTHPDNTRGDRLGIVDDEADAVHHLTLVVALLPGTTKHSNEGLVGYEIMFRRDISAKKWAHTIQGHLGRAVELATVAQARGLPVGELIRDVNAIDLNDGTLL